jgi:hypothetical protein
MTNRDKDSTEEAPSTSLIRDVYPCMHIYLILEMPMLVITRQLDLFILTISLLLIIIRICLSM